MEYEVLLSIIIPAFNAEKYVSRCLDSLILSIESDIEIIVVNDGSTDSTEQKLRTYSERFPYIKTLSQSNKGVSSARNAGLDISRGRYIAFVDIDDCVIPTAFADALQILRREKSNTYIFSHLEGNAQNGYFAVKQNLDDNDLSSLYVETCKQKLNEPWKKIYRADIIKNNNIRFSTEMVIGEDVCFFLEYIREIDKFVYIDNPFYVYEKNPDSVCANVQLSYLRQGYLVYEAIKRFIVDQDYPCSKEINERVFMHIVSRNIQALTNKSISKKEISHALRESGIMSELSRLKFSNFADCLRNRLILSEQFWILTFILNLMKGD